MSGIQVSLNNANLWNKFNSPMEMIVTRKNGNKMFPTLEYSVRGLNPTAMYEIYLHMERMDDHKYRYKYNGWDDYARADPITPIQKIKHKSGGQTGMYWMDGPISFEQVRLTNNSEMEKKDHIIIQSMHKWRPVVTIRELKNGDEEFRMENVWFIAVTIYYNPEIKSLKVENNKMASGYREAGHHKTTVLPTRGTKRTVSEAFPTPPLSTSPPSKIARHFPNPGNFEFPKMNPNDGNSPIPHHLPNQENFEFSKMNPNGHSPIAHHFPNPGNFYLVTEHQYWMNPYQNTWNCGYNMGQQIPQPVINQWNMQNMEQSKHMSHEQQGTNCPRSIANTPFSVNCVLSLQFLKFSNEQIDSGLPQIQSDVPIFDNRHRLE
ncbi:hypothetical protein L5515_019063 [Caenorhabditis briggsae]|uniref:T-box domain-containing protein n=1 Tax=Caenorhabditis briggsae TaxID=6238 RepID=A0AAE9JTM5_CAEBR|nr:hypothetical protein L5515_019063 [Caenorhabditis briggsae]